MRCKLVCDAFRKGAIKLLEERKKAARKLLKDGGR